MGGAREERGERGDEHRAGGDGHRGSDDEGDAGEENGTYIEDAVEAVRGKADANGIESGATIIAGEQAEVADEEVDDAEKRESSAWKLAGTSGQRRSVENGEERMRSGSSLWTELAIRVEGLEGRDRTESGGGNLMNSAKIGVLVGGGAGNGKQGSWRASPGRSHGAGA